MSGESVSNTWQAYLDRLSEDVEDMTTAIKFNGHDVKTYEIEVRLARRYFDTLPILVAEVRRLREVLEGLRSEAIEIINDAHPDCGICKPYAALLEALNTEPPV